MRLSGLPIALLILGYGCAEQSNGAATRVAAAIPGVGLGDGSVGLLGTAVAEDEQCDGES